MGGVIRAIASVGLIVVGVVTGNVGAIVAGVGNLVGVIAGAPGGKELKAQAGRLSASIDPGTARKMVFGRTAMATDVRYQAFTGTDQEYYHQIICCASHRVESIEELWLDQELAWSSTSGIASKFSGYLTVTPILEGSAANAINVDGNWNAANGCRLTGCAYVHIRYKRTGATKDNESPFSASITTRMTIVGKGCPVYDARYDSTRGGSGSMRADDQSTWAFTISGNDVGNNPAAQIATFMLGWRINGKLATGCGMPPNRVNWARSITSANACEETVTLAAGGSERRYRTACVIGESDERGAAFDLWKQSCNALLRDAGGLLAFDVLVNDIATPVVTFTEDDVLSAGTYKQAESLPDYRNIVRGKFTDPRSQSLYQLVDWPEIGVAAPDGIDRILTINYPGVQSVSQAQRLAKGQLQRRQFGGQLQIEVGQRGWIAQVGDPVRLTFWPMEFTTKAFRVAETKPQIDGRVQMLLTEESTTFYAWLNEDAPAITLPTPTTYDYLNNPLIVDDGADGEDGDYTDFKWIRQYAPPSTPTGDDPAGYTDYVPSGAATLWLISGRKSAAGVLRMSGWSTPKSFSELTARGPYNSGTTYYSTNVVFENGGTYIAIQSNFSGQAPSGTDQANAYWDVVAAPGAPGTPGTPPSGFSATIDLTSGAARNLRTIADAAGYTGASDATILYRVPSGVTIRGLGGTTAGKGIDVGTWPGGYSISLSLVVQSGGIVDGGGGNGGDGNSGGGYAGGDAIYCQYPISITIDSGGTVRAGGGGGGGGSRTSFTHTDGEVYFRGGGGGGGGAPNGAGGAGQVVSSPSPGSNGSDGSSGTTAGGGAGGGSAGIGGASGGTFATAGSSSTASGGAAGYAIRKNGYTVPVTNNGTLTGTSA